MGSILNINEIEAAAKEEIFKGKKVKALVAFIDLLGFKDEIINKWDNEEESPLFRLMKFKNFVSLAKEKGKTHDYYEDDNGIKLLAKISYPDIITFSDSFIFILPIDNFGADNILCSILSISSSIAELWRQCINGGFTIRGGVDFGEIFYIDKDLVGPSLIESYKLESKIAMISRVVYSNEVLKAISNNLGKANPKIQDYFKRYLTKDIDERIILNLIVAYGYKNSEEIQEGVEKLKNMRDNVNKTELKAKYNNLIAWLRSERDPDNDFKIFKPY